MLRFIVIVVISVLMFYFHVCYVASAVVLLFPLLPLSLERTRAQSLSFLRAAIAPPIPRDPTKISWVPKELPIVFIGEG